MRENNVKSPSESKWRVASLTIASLLVLGVLSACAPSCFQQTPSGLGVKVSAANCMRNRNPAATPASSLQASTPYVPPVTPAAEVMRYQTQANEGNAGAMYSLAFCYDGQRRARCEGVAPDPQQKQYWLDKATKTQQETTRLDRRKEDAEKKRRALMMERILKRKGKPLSHQEALKFMIKCKYPGHVPEEMPKSGSKLEEQCAAFVEGYDACGTFYGMAFLLGGQAIPPTELNMCVRRAYMGP